MASSCINRTLAASAALLLAIACIPSRDATAREDWNEVPEWHLSATPILKLGDAEVAEPELFGNLRGAALMSDGSIAVADASSNDIRVVTQDGTHRYTVGPDGRGPGEFREIWGVPVGPGDTIWGYDQPNWKLVAFHDTTYYRDMSINRAQPLRWSGRVLVATATPGTASERPYGLQRHPMSVVVYPPSADAPTTMPGPGDRCVCCARECRSLVVAGLLAASGIVGVVYGLIRTEFLTAISFPGPIFGIIIGVPMLGLAVVEAVGATRDRKSQGTTQPDRSGG